MAQPPLRGNLSYSKLCSECAHILSQAWEVGIAIPPGHPRWDKPLSVDSTVFPWHPTLAASRESAAVNDCHFCMLICRYSELPSSVDEQKPLVTGFLHNDGSYVRNDFATIRSHGEQNILALNIRYARAQVWEGAGPSPKYGHHDNAGRVPPGLFAMLKEWMAQCQSEHPECQRVRNDVVPSRVIEISGGDEASPKIRLVDASADVKNKYATLSHCWGPNPDLSHLPRTTRETVDSHYVSISYNALSATFKDAITVTRQLGLKYLWADSLCIIQEDKSDWEQESSKMADIYANSSVTIAATGFRGRDGGLFLLRKEDEMKPVIWRTPEAGKVLAFHPFLARGYFDYETIPRPLYSRAWCMQELTLSRRVLHFLPGQIIMDCAGATVYEFEKMSPGSDTSACILQDLKPSSLEGLKNGHSLPPTSVPVDMNMKNFHTIFPTSRDIPNYLEQVATDPERIMTVCFGHPRRSGDLLQNLRKIFTNTPKKKPAIGTRASRYPKTIYDEWRSLVENYETKDITYPNDRLPAIWSFVQRMREIVNDRYLCGIWQSDIPHGLTFMLQSPSPALGVPSPAPPAPSWSWAAHEGQIRYYGDGRLHGTKSKEPDPLGRATLVDFHSEMLRDSHAAMGRSTHAMLTLKCTYATITGTPDIETPGKLLRQGKIEMALDSSQLVLALSGIEIYCVHLMDFCGLLVRPAGPDKTEFERVGLCYARHQGSTSLKDIQQDYLDLPWQHGDLVLI